MRTGKILLVLVLLLVSGCETLNDAIVRQWHKDWEVSRRTKSQILDGLKRRERDRAPTAPTRPAPPFMDEARYYRDRNDRENRINYH